MRKLWMLWVVMALLGSVGLAQAGYGQCTHYDWATGQTVTGSVMRICTQTQETVRNWVCDGSRLVCAATGAVCAFWARNTAGQVYCAAWTTGCTTWVEEQVCSWKTQTEWVTKCDYKCVY
jgi:hypothetical protein